MMTVRYRALFHLTEAGKTAAVLQAVRNLRAEMGDGVKAFLLTGQYVDDVRRMNEEGVRFAVCANSMRAMNLP
jgi:intracellular sulfur oxidation DsrE/DsrF family protein